MTRHYDHDSSPALRAEEPTLTIGRLRYRGRVLSIVEWLPFYERLNALNASNQPGAGVRARLDLCRDYLRAVFPRRRYAFWAPDPVLALARAPGNGLEEAFGRFFFHQLRLLFPVDAEPTTMPMTPPTSGPPLPDATADDETVLGA